MGAPCRPLDAGDPAAAVLDAHRRAALLALPTSGTTGRPRTVLRTAASWVDSFPTVGVLTGLDAAARVWVPGPLTATMNLFAATLTRWAGATRVGSATEASHLQLTPAGLHRLLADGVDLGGRTLLVAGDALAGPLRRRAEAARARVCHYYGAAELSFVGWGRDADDLRPFPGVEVEVRDGELWARSPFLAERVEGAPGPLRRDADGYATVGDRGGWADHPGGRLRVAGRGDAVVTAGLTVMVADVEAALRPALRGRLAVLGLPHPRLGAVLVAVLTDPADRAPARAAAAGLGAARPRRWLLRPSLPTTDAGKVDRATLAAELTAESDSTEPAR